MKSLTRITLIVLFLCGTALPGTTQAIRLVSYNSSSEQSNGDSLESRVSANGRYVAFSSEGSNLGVSGTGGLTNIYLRDRKLHITDVISISSSGTAANQNSHGPAVSNDGRFVVFESAATNLVVPDPTGGETDVFIRDRVLGVTSIASVGVSGNSVPGDQPSLSSDGRFLAFRSGAASVVPGDTNAQDDIFVRDLVAGTTIRASLSTSGLQPNGSCARPSISDDGRYVAYHSAATNLVLGDSNSATDVFLTDLLTGTTISPTCNPDWIIGNMWSNNPSLSADGRYVAFQSAASNLVFGDSNGYIDCFVYDRLTTNVERVNLSNVGAQSTDDGDDPKISGNGRVVAFTSDDVLDGSGISNGQKQAYVRNLDTGTTVCISKWLSLPTSSGFANSLSYTGQVASFDSNSTNLVVADVNSRYDVFEYEFAPTCSGHSVYCTAKVNSLGCLPSICAWGALSLSATEDCLVQASNVLNNKTGMMIWSHSPGSSPFQGGTLCLSGSIRRTPPQGSGGSTIGNSCTGRYSFALGPAYITAQGIPAGATLYCQFWSRDPFLPPPHNSGLTDAVALLVTP